jgi:dCMP deaminase
MRPSKLENYMEIACTVAKRSHDSETKVGALLINNKSNAILATGYNGFIKGACDSILPNTRPEKYEYILHAEMNLLTNCARHGISMDDCFLVCTLSPCKLCARLMMNSGITRAICKDLYRDFSETVSMKDVDVSYEKTPEGFYEIIYRPNVGSL